jgi:hypothetical protein
LLLVTGGAWRIEARDDAATRQALHQEGQLNAEMKRWLSRRRTSFGTEAWQESESFATATRRLHEQLVAGSGVPQLQSDAAELFESWRRLYGYILKCDTAERENLQSLAVRITPPLIELQTLLAP